MTREEQEQRLAEARARSRVSHVQAGGSLDAVLPAVQDLLRTGSWEVAERLAREAIEQAERRRPAWSPVLARALVAAYRVALERGAAPGPNLGAVPTA